MKTRTIKSKLVNREEVFQAIALAESTGFPVLLQGPPGVGKTRALLEYAMAFHKDNQEKAKLSTFVLEVNEGTRPNDVVGKISAEKLLTENKTEYDSPIVDANFVLINEIDKATTGVRNSFLSIMNEKRIYRGKQKVKCNWSVFCASCNEIPQDEEDSPFWDRFVLKLQVNRLSKRQLMNLFETDEKNSFPEIKINIPDQQDLDKVVFRPEHLEKFIEVLYNSASDRSLYKAKTLAAAIHYVLDLSPSQSLIKAAEFLADKEVSRTLAESIEPPEVSQLRSNITKLSMMDKYDDINNLKEEIKQDIIKLNQKGKIDKDLAKDLAFSMNKAINENEKFQEWNTKYKNLSESVQNNKRTDLDEGEDSEELEKVDITNRI